MHLPSLRPSRILGALIASTALLVAGCSTDSSDTADAPKDVTTTVAPTTTILVTTTSAGDKAAFCAAGEAINAKTSTIAGPDQAVTVFTELDPTLDTMLASAPTEVADAAATFVSIARASVKSGDFTPFEDGTIDALVQQFDAVCANG